MTPSDLPDHTPFRATPFLTDIEPGKLISVTPSDLPEHVAKLHEDEGAGAEDEYDVS